METPTPAPQKRAWGGILIGAAAFVLVTGGLIYLMTTIGTERLQAWVEGAGPLAPIAYMLLRALTYVFAPLTTGPIQLASGALFGLWEGIVYSLIGEALGGSINFWIGRKLGRPVVLRIAGEQGLSKAEEYYHLVGEWRGLAIARVVLFALWDFLSYVIGFTSVRYRDYLLVSLIMGFIPTAAAVFVGSRLGGEDQGLLMVGIIALCVVVSLPVLFAGRLRKMMEARRSADSVDKNP